MEIQPNPKPSQGDLWQELINEMQARRELGIQRYGTPLQANNGRDALKDLRDELLDGVIYSYQLEKEQKQDNAEFAELLKLTTEIARNYHFVGGSKSHLGSFEECKYGFCGMYWEFLKKANKP